MGVSFGSLALSLECVCVLMAYSPAFISFPAWRFGLGVAESRRVCFLFCFLLFAVLLFAVLLFAVHGCVHGCASIGGGLSAGMGWFCCGLGAGLVRLVVIGLELSLSLSLGLGFY